MFASIRWRIAIPLVLIICLSMAGLGVVLSNLVRQSKMEDIQQGLETSVLLLAEQLVQQDLLQNPSQIDEHVDDWARVTGMRITVIDASGEVIGESHQDHNQMENHADRPEFLQAMSSGLGNSVRYSETLDFDMLYTAAPFAIDGENAGVVRAAFSLESLEDDVQELQETIWLGAGISALVMASVALWFYNRTVSPLASLIASTRGDQAEDSGVKIHPDRRDDIDQLALALDGMTAQLQARFEALQAERAKLSAILAQMTDGVLLVTPEGDVTMTNTAARELFDVPIESPLGISLIRLFGQHQLVEIWEECLRTGEIRILEMQSPRLSRHIQATAIPLGEILIEHTLIMLRDLTEMRRLETVRRDFLSNISHELRTPLASLKALSETLEMGAMEDPDTAERFIALMKKELDSLAQLVSELLELSRIESGQVPLKLLGVDPCALMAKVSERMALQAEHAKLTLKVDCPETLPQVLADLPRIEQVLLNLVHNAIKFTRPGGEVVLGSSVRPSMIEFFVIDTGVGIPAADLSRIFERFYKTAQGRQREGTGLGLAIAKHLVEAHGGQIWAESEEGQGSIFRFTLPQA